MRERSWLRFLCPALVFFGAPALLVFLADPFFHYHEPWFGLAVVEEEKEYQVPGMLRNFAYDNVLAGSSVVMSMNTETLDERFGGRTVKAVGGSASAPLLAFYLQTAFEEHELSRVFYGVDVFSFYNDPDMSVISEDVAYLVNKNPFDDVEYLWNMDVLAEKIPRMIEMSRQEPCEGLLYQINRGSPLGPKEVLKMHCPGAGMLEEKKPADYMGAHVQENLNRLEALVAAHPKTQFLFFIPPYNIVWWDDAYEKGLLDAYLHTLDVCMSRLLPYENVRFYATDFNEAGTITDMYQYMDYIHGGPAVTDRMAEQIGTAEQEITPENKDAELQKLSDTFYRFRERVEAEGYGFVYETVN